MPAVPLPGVHLWYTDTGGTATPVIFMHAASGTCDSWVYQTPAFTAAGYRCVAYDRRYWGRSRSEPADAPPGSASEDLHGLVTHLGLERFHLVATAAGGIGALDYAVEHPERVRSLVVSNTIGGLLGSRATWKCSIACVRRRFKPCRSSCVNSGRRIAVRTRRGCSAGWSLTTPAGRSRCRRTRNSHVSP